MNGLRNDAVNKKLLITKIGIYKHKAPLQISVYGI